MPTISRKALRSVMFHALAKHAAKEKDRSLLDAGRSYSLEITVEARSGRLSLTEEIVGELNVGHDSEAASSSGCNQAELCAYLLSQMPKAKRMRILDELPAKFERLGALPDTDKEVIDSAGRMLERLRYRKTITKAGAVAFNMQPAKESA